MREKNNWSKEDGEKGKSKERQQNGKQNIARERKTF